MRSTMPVILMGLVLLAPVIADEIDVGVFKARRAVVMEEGIGIRIEDVVLVAKDGPVVLSRHIPRTVQEIEDAMHGQTTLQSLLLAESGSRFSPKTEDLNVCFR